MGTIEFKADCQLVSSYVRINSEKYIQTQTETQIQTHIVEWPKNLYKNASLENKIMKKIIGLKHSEFLHNLHHYISIYIIIISIIYITKYFYKNLELAPIPE